MAAIGGLRPHVYMSTAPRVGTAKEHRNVTEEIFFELKHFLLARREEIWSSVYSQKEFIFVRASRVSA